MSEITTNPYASPSFPAASATVSLNRIQRRNLVSWWKHKQKSYTNWELLLLAARGWMVMCASIFAGAVLCYWLFDLNIDVLVTLSVFSTSFVFGVIMRDVAAIRQFLNLWPSISDVIDWDRVAARLNNE